MPAMRMNSLLTARGDSDGGSRLEIRRKPNARIDLGCPGKEGISAREKEVHFVHRVESAAADGPPVHVGDRPVEGVFADRAAEVADAEDAFIDGIGPHSSGPPA